MEQSPRKKFIIAQLLSWGAAVVVCLILTYAVHGPANHPKVFMIFVCCMPSVVISLLPLRGHYKTSVLVTLACIWFTALGAGLILQTLSIGESLPPYSLPIVFLVLGAIAITILRFAAIDAPDAETTESKSLKTVKEGRAV